MIDADGSGDVSYKELVRAIKGARAAGVAVSTKGQMDVKDVLRQIRMHMKTHQVRGAPGSSA